MDNEKLRKVFVGNVPYECTQDEFENIFCNVDGFINAEIVIDKNNNMCRGFGFVTLNTIQNADNLLDNSNISIHGRELRLTGYTSTHKYINTDKIGYVYVDNIPNNSDRSYLEDVFARFSLGKHYVNTDIDTGEPKNNGIVEILNAAKYKELLTAGFISDKNNHVLKLCKHKSILYKKKDQTVTKHDLHKAFLAGRNVGLMERSAEN